MCNRARPSWNLRRRKCCLCWLQYGAFHICSSSSGPLPGEHNARPPTLRFWLLFVGHITRSDLRRNSQARNRLVDDFLEHHLSYGNDEYCYALIRWRYGQSSLESLDDGIVDYSGDRLLGLLGVYLV